MGVLVEVAGEDKLVGAGLLQEDLQARTNLLRPPITARPKKLPTASCSWGSHNGAILSTGGFCFRLSPRISASTRWKAVVARNSASSSVGAAISGTPIIA